MLNLRIKEILLGEILHVKFLIPMLIS